MQRPSRLLVVTPTLGTSQYFTAMMDSIRALRISVLHVVVAPEARHGELQRLCPQALLVPEKRYTRGIYDALNQGLAAAAGEEWDWFTYINDDDRLCGGVDDCLASAKEDDDLCYGVVNKIDDSGRQIEPIATLRTPRHFLALANEGIAGFNQQGAAIRRRMWEKVGPFDSEFKICADLDFFVRVALVGGGLRYFPVVTGEFRIRHGQISQNVVQEFREQSRLREKNRLEHYRPKSWRVKQLFRLQNASIYLRRALRGRFYTSHQMLAGELR